MMPSNLASAPTPKYVSGRVGCNTKTLLMSIFFSQLHMAGPPGVVARRLKGRRQTTHMCIKSRAIRYCSVI